MTFTLWCLIYHTLRRGLGCAMEPGLPSLCSPPSFQNLRRRGGLGATRPLGAGAVAVGRDRLATGKEECLCSPRSSLTGRQGVCILVDPSDPPATLWARSGPDPFWPWAARVLPSRSLGIGIGEALESRGGWPGGARRPPGLGWGSRRWAKSPAWPAGEQACLLACFLASPAQH